MTTTTHWIDGTPDPGTADRRGPVFDPATGTQTGEVVLGGSEDVARAVASAARAFQEWRESSLATRSAVMFAFRELLVRHEEELARLITAEHGKTIDDARGEVVRGREVVEFACGIGEALKGSFSDQVSTGVDVHTFRQPLGVCAGITPFNFPIMVPLWMHPIAIATGNTFLLKPSERDPSVSLRVAELYAEAGLPDGVFNVINGDKVAVDAILDHPDIAAVSFVGSTPIAKYVHQRGVAAGKRVQALGGAKNHAVVLPDADLDAATANLTAAAFGSAGQRCMAISVGVAVGPVADALVDRLADAARAVRVGPGTDPASEMGPVITAAARQRVEAAVGTAAQQGATVVVDGRGHTVPGHEAGFFTGASLVDRVTPGMDLYRQEVFGPVLAVTRVDSVDAAIELVNANPYGNGTAVFTSSGPAARHFARQVTVGMVGVNVPVPVPMAYYSFGGWKDSLIGDSPVHGPEGIRFHTRPKVITSRWPTPAGHDSFAFPTTS